MTVANWAKFSLFFFSTHFSKFPIIKIFLQRKNYFLPYGFYSYYKQNIIKWLQISTLFESRCFLREVVKKKNAMTVIRERNLRFSQRKYYWMHCPILCPSSVAPDSPHGTTCKAQLKVINTANLYEDNTQHSCGFPPCIHDANT